MNQALVIAQAQPAWLASLAGQAGGWLAAERERWALWIPVAFGCGIGLYFGLDQEPPVWAGLAALGVATALGILGRRHQALVILAVGLASLAAGVATAQWHARISAAPVLERPIASAELHGTIAAVEVMESGQRLLLEQVWIRGVTAERTPARVRVRLMRDSPVRPGERVALRASLSPPMAPAAPGAYDFQLQAWFMRIGAVGYAFSAPRVLAPAAPEAGWTVTLERLRHAATERIMGAIPGPAGAVAAALITGQMSAIPRPTVEAMRDSGLAHLLSISGLHLALVGGIVFAALRFGFALVPPLALRFPVKKWSAVVAWIATSFYTLFAGASVPTQRSWVMLSIVFLAVLLDRSALSMRLVAWAGVVVLAIAPESLLGPSFQMSFAAVVALIAAYEAAAPAMMRLRARAGAVRKAALNLGSIALTSVVAGLATAPFALYHFNRFTLYALAANMIAVPLTGVWVMPWAVLAMVLMPFGLDGPALAAMGWGVEGIIAVAEWVAGWDGAVAVLPAMPAWGVIAVALGGLWLCIWRQRWRLAGLAPIAIGLASLLLVRGPDVLVSGDGELVALRNAAGRLELSGKASRIVRETWLRRDGQLEATPDRGITEDAAQTACDSLGCTLTLRGQVVAVVRDPAALAEDCAIATVVVASFPVRRRCGSARLVIDRFSLWREGAHALWIEADGAVRVETVRGARGVRPWVQPLPAPRRRGQAEG